jgi:hypothetical protein
LSGLHGNNKSTKEDTSVKKKKVVKPVLKCGFELRALACVHVVLKWLQHLLWSVTREYKAPTAEEVAEECSILVYVISIPTTEDGWCTETKDGYFFFVLISSSSSLLPVPT